MSGRESGREKRDSENERRGVGREDGVGRQRREGERGMYMYATLRGDLVDSQHKAFFLKRFTQHKPNKHTLVPLAVS